jgi:hypothetical protein
VDCAVIATAALAISGVPAIAQPLGRPPTLLDLKGLAGPIVAEARTAPETPMGITGYQVRRLALPNAWIARLDGDSVSVSQAWHVTVFFAKPLSVRDQAFSLAIDNQWCGFLAEAPDLLSADAVCFDARLIDDGKAVGVTYRPVTIAPPDQDVGAFAPAARLETQDSEPIHYSTARLRLRAR